MKTFRNPESPVMVMNKKSVVVIILFFIMICGIFSACGSGQVMQNLSGVEWGMHQDEIQVALEKNNNFTKDILCEEFLRYTDKNGYYYLFYFDDDKLSAVSKTIILERYTEEGWDKAEAAIAGDLTNER